MADSLTLADNSRVRYVHGRHHVLRPGRSTGSAVNCHTRVGWSVKASAPGKSALISPSSYVRTVLSIWKMMLPVVMVTSLALAMAICKSINSATAIRHLYVSRQPRACGRIKNLWFDRREFEVLRDKQRRNSDRHWRCKDRKTKQHYRPLCGAFRDDPFECLACRGLFSCLVWSAANLGVTMKSHTLLIVGFALSMAGCAENEQATPEALTRFERLRQ